MRTEQEERLYKLNMENFARRIAAKKMGLENDADGNNREGRNLPDELWKQALPEAERWMQFNVEHRGAGYAHVTVSGTCPADATVKEVEERFYH